MLNAINSLSQALSAVGTGIAVRANNIANVESKNYTPKEPTFSSGPSGGVVVDIRERKDKEGVDLIEEITATRQLETSYKGIANTIRSISDTEDAVLDILSGSDSRRRRY